MARPKKDTADRRTERVNPRFTPAERLTLEHAAIAAGMSAGEYVRRQALHGRVVTQQRRALDPAVFDELRRIGINLNQLARIANQTGRLPARLERACAALEEILVRELDQAGPARGARPAAPAGGPAPPPEPAHGP